MSLFILIQPKYLVLPQAFEVAASCCGIDHTMCDPGNPLLDICMGGEDILLSCACGVLVFLLFASMAAA